MAARPAAVVGTAATSHSVSKPKDRLFRLVEPIRSISSSKIDTLAWTMIRSPPVVCGAKAKKRLLRSACSSRNSTSERAVSMVIWSNQLGLPPVETSTTSGLSGSDSRLARASAIFGEVKYWFSR